MWKESEDYSLQLGGGRTQNNNRFFMEFCNISLIYQENPLMFTTTCSQAKGIFYHNFIISIHELSLASYTFMCKYLGTSVF